jgi:hypothetical protein
LKTKTPSSIQSHKNHNKQNRDIYWYTIITPEEYTFEYLRQDTIKYFTDILSDPYSTVKRKESALNGLRETTSKYKKSESKRVTKTSIAISIFKHSGEWTTVHRDTFTSRQRSTLSITNQKKRQIVGEAWLFGCPQLYRGTYEIGKEVEELDFKDEVELEVSTTKRWNKSVYDVRLLHSIPMRHIIAVSEREGTIEEVYKYIMKVKSCNLYYAKRYINEILDKESAVGKLPKLIERILKTNKFEQKIHTIYKDLHSFLEMVKIKLSLSRNSYRGHITKTIFSKKTIDKIDKITKYNSYIKEYSYILMELRPLVGFYKVKYRRKPIRK